MTKIVGPETSPTDSTWPVRPICMMKNVGPETSPTGSTGHVEAVGEVNSASDRNDY
jgi:hypothetical protein